jgi:hypothetical protein
MGYAGVAATKSRRPGVWRDLHEIAVKRRGSCAIALPGLEKSYGQFAHFHHSNKGVVD